MDLKGAEIFSVGTWNGLPFTQDDLNAITAAFDELGSAGRVPLKFGHNTDQPVTDGQPALGWVHRVWSEGGKLLADFVDLPSQVFEAIKNGLYKFVSIELLKDVEREGRQSPWVLDAVALLGAEPPAVRNLRDLQSLTMSDVPGLRFGSRVAFALVDPSSTNRRPKGMGENTNDADKAELAKFAAENATLVAANKQLLADIDKRDAEKRAAEITNHRGAIKAKFEDAVKRRVLSPASRDLFYKMQGIDSERVLECTDEVVKSYIDFNGVKPDQREAFSRRMDDDEQSGNNEDDKTPADALVAERVSELLEKHEGMTHRDAMISVFRRDPVLGKRYMFQRG